MGGRTNTLFEPQELEEDMVIIFVSNADLLIKGPETRLNEIQRLHAIRTKSNASAAAPSAGGIYQTGRGRAKPYYRVFRRLFV